MKIITWALFDMADLEYLADGLVMFDDHRTQYNLQVGDMIQQLSDDEDYGTLCYIVENVIAEVNPAETRGTTVVVARELG